MTEHELRSWGARIGSEAPTPLVLALRGELGAGKSTLARAIARGAGVEGSIPSPTFNLLFRYASPRGIEIVHLDLYRLERPEEVWALGWSELPDERDIVMVEWPERAEELLPTPRWEIELLDDGAPESRSVEAKPVGEPPALPPMSGG
jgi:tRNA threonylcarbamoyladenosine biosynthesis protein TsaE